MAEELIFQIRFPRKNKTLFIVLCLQKYSKENKFTIPKYSLIFPNLKCVHVVFFNIKYFSLFYPEY